MNIKAQAYPNPFTSNLSVEVLSENEDKVIFRLFTPDRSLLKMSYWKLLKGNNKIILDNLHNLASGIYTMELQNESNEILYKFELTKQ